MSDSTSGALLRADALWASIADHLEPLPLPGGGRTDERLDRLWQMATVSPSAARLGEAHLDAVAILAEAGRVAPRGGRLGVWAARGAQDCMLAATPGGGLRLIGDKPWCTAATSATHALVTAEHQGSGALVLVDMQRAGISLPPPQWISPAFADTDTRTVSFDLIVDDADVIGVDDWYLRRPGFWHGAVGVAACWAGSVAGIVGRIRPQWPANPHAAAHLGAVDAALWSMHALLTEAGREIDAVPDDALYAQQRALRVRHAVDATIDDVLRRVTRALGPGPLAHRPDLHVELSEVDLYRRQCHAERDLEALGNLVNVPGEPLHERSSR